MSYSIKAKLMIAVTSATVFGMSAFMERAEAQRATGNSYSQPDINELRVDAQFDFVNTKKEGERLLNTQGDFVGRRFLGAIENYTKGEGILCSDGIDDKINDKDNPICKKGYIKGSYFFDSANYPIFKTAFQPSTNPFDGDLVAEFLNYGQKPIFKDALYFDEFDKFFEKNPNQNAIVYSIVKPGETENAVFSYLLKLSDIPNNDRCENVNDECRSLNDLEFILKNNLLGQAVPVRAVNGGSFSNQTRALIQNQFGEDMPVATVPEPSLTLGALAAVGAGSLLKRKTKQS
jgi:hypothetical protein